MEYLRVIKWNKSYYANMGKLLSKLMKYYYILVCEQDASFIYLTLLI